MSLVEVPSALTAPELLSIAREYAACESLWRPHVRHDASQRQFARVAALADHSAWLVCWMPGQDTGFHDHAGSSGAVVVIAGNVVEERLRFARAPHATVYGPGEAFEFGPADIHRVAHAGTEPAITLHAYSPYLKGMGAYVEDGEGRLQRHWVGEHTELRPDLVVA